MGDSPRQHRGFSFIELVVVIAILAVLMGFGVSSFTTMIQNSQIRAQAEGIANGVQLARSEAIKRNRMTLFQLVNTLDATCILSMTGPYWLVSVRRDPDPANPTGPIITASTLCNSAPDPAGDYSNVRILYKPESRATSTISLDTVNGPTPQTVNTPSIKNVGIDAGANLFCFNGLGQLSKDNYCDGPTGITNIDLTAPKNGTCVAAGGPIRCLRVMIFPNGATRICDPALTKPVTEDSRSCLG